MKLRPIATTAIIAGLTIGTIAIAFAQPGRRGGASWDAPRAGQFDRAGFPGFDGPHGHRGQDGPNHRKLLFPFWEKEEVAQELQLTDEQVAALSESLDILKSELEATEGSVMDAHKALREAMQVDSPDLNTIYELHDAAAEAKAEKGKIFLAHAVTVKNVLTEDQEETLKELRPRRPGREMFRNVMTLRGDIKDTIRDGGDIEDVEALLEERQIPEGIQDRILNRVEERLAELEERLNSMEDDR